MTLKEVIVSRQNKGDSHRQGVSEPWWDGYYTGWYWAYKDLMEILEQNGFDLDSVVIK